MRKVDFGISFDVFWGLVSWFCHVLSTVLLLDYLISALTMRFDARPCCRNFVHGERWPQYQRLSVLPVHREDRLVGWQALCLWRCDRRLGDSEELRRDTDGFIFHDVLCPP